MSSFVNIEDVVKDILKSILKAEEQENIMRCCQFIESLKDSGYDIEDMEEFDILINYQLKKALSQAISYINSFPEGVDKNKLTFLYLNYRFMENHVRNLIMNKEGSICCADKARWILEKYKNYILTGETVEMGKEIRFCTPGFGEFFDWVNYCDSLYHLFNGDPIEYVSAYTNLLKKESRISA